MTDDINKFVQEIIDGSIAKLKQSRSFVAIISDSFLDNPQCLLELAGAIVLDKPMIFIVKTGVRLPKKIEKVADKIMYFDDDKSFMEQYDQILAFIKEKTEVG